MDIPAANLATPGQQCLQSNLIENFPSPARIKSSDASISWRQEDISVVPVRAFAVAMKNQQSSPVVVTALAVLDAGNNTWTSSFRQNLPDQEHDPPAESNRILCRCRAIDPDTIRNISAARYYGANGIVPIRRRHSGTGGRFAAILSGKSDARPVNEVLNVRLIGMAAFVLPPGKFSIEQIDNSIISARRTFHCSGDATCSPLASFITSGKSGYGFALASS